MRCLASVRIIIFRTEHKRSMHKQCVLASLEDIKIAGEIEELEEDEDNKLTNGPSADHTNSNRHVGVVVVVSL